MGALSDFFYGDHKRLAALLDRSVDGGANDPAYAEFRRALFAHIAIEERCVLPAIVEAKGGKPLLTARRVRADHRAIHALLGLPPSRGTIGVLRKLLLQHEALEDGPGGLYGSGEELLGDRAAQVLDQCRAFRPEDPAPGLASAPDAYDEAIRALSQAGLTVTEGDLRAP